MEWEVGVEATAVDLTVRCAREGKSGDTVPSGKYHPEVCPMVLKLELELEL